MAHAFDEEKATQAAARFLRHAGGSMPYLKLMKLLYMADRVAIDRYGSPITGDRYVSMEHGPVLSGVLDAIKNRRRTETPTWDRCISTNPADFTVTLCAHPEEVLSVADEELIDEVFEQYGHVNQWDLVKYVHQEFPEWKVPQGTRKCLPISLDDILAALGKSEEAKGEIRSTILVSRLIDRVAARRR